PEYGHHRVANELLDGTGTSLELRTHMGVVGREEAADVLRIEPFSLGSEPDEVDEDHRDDLPPFAERALVSLKQAPACVAEPRTFRVLLPATRARQHRESVRRPSSLVTFRASRRPRLRVRRGSRVHSPT